MLRLISKLFSERGGHPRIRIRKKVRRARRGRKERRKKTMAKTKTTREMKKRKRRDKECTNAKNAVAYITNNHQSSQLNMNGKLYS